MGCTDSLMGCAGFYVPDLFGGLFPDLPMAVPLPVVEALCLADIGIYDPFASTCTMPWEGEGVDATLNICCYGDLCCANIFVFDPAEGDFYVAEGDCVRPGFNICQGLTCLADDGGHCEEVEEAVCASNFTDFFFGDDVCLTSTPTNTPTAFPTSYSSSDSDSGRDSDSGSGRGRGRGRGRDSGSDSEEELFAAALNPNTRTQSDEHIRGEKIAQLFGFDLSKTLKRAKRRDLDKSGISMAELAKKFEVGKSGSPPPDAKTDGNINILDGDEAETKTITVSVAQNTFLSMFAMFAILLISSLSCWYYYNYNQKSSVLVSNH